MKPSDTPDVSKMCYATADSYPEMMEQEIQLPVYADVLSRLQDRIAKMPGTLLDTACEKKQSNFKWKKR